MKQDSEHIAADLLPAKISAITVQKKNSDRFSIFVRDEFLVGISSSVLTKFNLSKNDLITKQLFDKIVAEEDKWKAKDYMLRILGRRDHSRRELKNKAIRKGYDEHHLEELLDEFEEKGYINDSKFAEKFVADKFEFNDWGPYKIKTELMKKGVSGRMAERAIDRTLPEDELTAKLSDLVLKKKKRFRRVPEEKRKKKVFDFLMRKGYDSDDIFKHMDELLDLVKE